MLDDIFNHRFRPAGAHEFIHHVAPYRNPPYTVFDNDLDSADGIVVVLPARHCVAHYDYINEWIARYPWVLLLVTGDEESNFEAQRIKHPNIKRWQQLPKPGVHDFADRFLINGFPAPIHQYLPKLEKFGLLKPLNWFFSGQITHVRRRECVDVLRNIQLAPDGKMVYGILKETEGFTQGMPHDEYYQFMAMAKLVPCPSGAVMPDSFRLAEALEAGCIPIADGVSPRSDWPRGYWPYVFGEQPPFPIIENWPDMLKLDIGEWPANANRCFAWWGQYKRKLAYWMRDDINSLRKEDSMSERIDDKITVLIPTSPIPSHPDTYKIDQVIASIRHHLPESEIIIMCDGPRAEVMHRRTQYEEYKQRILWKAHHDPAWKNITVKVFEESGVGHKHQSGIVRETLPMVKTPLVFFNEHDAPLTEDPIDFGNMARLLETGDARIIRLYYFPALIPEHSHLMHGNFAFEGQRYVRTTQYSGWPHLTTTANMADLLAHHTPWPGKETMLETAFYGTVTNSPWDRYRVVIYAPDGSMQRFSHTNGRGEGAERDGVDW